MSGKTNNEALAKDAGFAVANSSHGYFWFKTLFPEDKGPFLPTEREAWAHCVNRHELLDA